MNKRAQKRSDYLRGYSMPFYNWWEGIEMHSFIEWRWSEDFDKGFQDARQWIQGHLPPIETHLTDWMLWARPIQAEEIANSIIDDLNKEMENK